MLKSTHRNNLLTYLQTNVNFTIGLGRKVAVIETWRSRFNPQWGQQFSVKYVIQSIDCRAPRSPLDMVGEWVLLDISHRKIFL